MQGPNAVEPVQCVYVRVQGIGADSAVQGDREAERLSGATVLAEVLRRRLTRQLPNRRYMEMLNTVFAAAVLEGIERTLEELIGRVDRSDVRDRRPRSRMRRPRSDGHSK